jgi:hypothetical protein
MLVLLGYIVNHKYPSNISCLFYYQALLLYQSVTTELKSMSKNSHTTYVFFLDIFSMWVFSTWIHVNIQFLQVYFSINMLQKACGKFKFLSNNCSAKNVYFSILLYRQYASNSLWKVWILLKQFFVKEDVFFHSIVQAICFKKPVESLSSCQTIARQKRIIFPQIADIFFIFSLAIWNFRTLARRTMNQFFEFEKAVFRFT